MSWLVARPNLLGEKSRREWHSMGLTKSTPRARTRMAAALCRHGRSTTVRADAPDFLHCKPPPVNRLMALRPNPVSGSQSFGFLFLLGGSAGAPMCEWQYPTESHIPANFFSRSAFIDFDTHLEGCPTSSIFIWPRKGFGCASTQSASRVIRWDRDVLCVDALLLAPRISHNQNS